MEDFKTARLMSMVLTQYYLEGKRQADIAQDLNLSTPKVNRLLKQARDQGLVEIKIHTPYLNIFEIEKRLLALTGLQDTVVVPKLTTDTASVLQAIGSEGADYLLRHLRDGDIICMGGGRTIEALVQAIQPERRYEVQVVPAIGGVQGMHHTNLNYLVAELAHKLGGRAYQLHAPAFVDSPEEREAVLGLRQVGDILALARQARIALVGIGAVSPLSSSYFQFTSLDTTDMTEIVEREHGVGEILAHIYTADGHLCATDYARRVVALSPEELKNIPITIGLAATASKVLPVYGMLKGQFLNRLITDEEVATPIVEKLEKELSDTH